MSETSKMHDSGNCLRIVSVKSSTYREKKKQILTKACYTCLFEEIKLIQFFCIKILDTFGFCVSLKSHLTYSVTVTMFALDAALHTQLSLKRYVHSPLI